MGGWGRCGWLEIETAGGRRGWLEAEGDSRASTKIAGGSAQAPLAQTKQRRRAARTYVHEEKRRDKCRKEREEVGGSGYLSVRRAALLNLDLGLLRPSTQPLTRPPLPISQPHQPARETSVSQPTSTLAPKLIVWSTALIGHPFWLPSAQAVLAPSDLCVPAIRAHPRDLDKIDTDLSISEPSALPQIPSSSTPTLDLDGGTYSLRRTSPVPRE